MALRLTIGEVDAAAALSSTVTLPVLAEVGVRPWVSDSLDEVIRHRRGVAIIAPGGAGKSMALAVALQLHCEAEMMAEQRDPNHRRRQVVSMLGTRAASRRDWILALWKATCGYEPNMRSRGRAKSDGELLDALVETMALRNVVAVVVDEAETVSSEGFLVLRDVMTRAELRGEDRMVFTEGGSMFRSAGVGVLLLGTEALESVRLGVEERRWVRLTRVGLIPSKMVGVIYRKFLPAFEAHITKVGENAWARFIHEKVTLGRDLPVSSIEDHVRSYIRRVHTMERRAVPREEIEFNKDLFVACHNEGTWSMRGSEDDAA